MNTGLLNQIARSTIEALKQISAQGKPLTEQTLYQSLKTQTQLIRSIQKNSEGNTTDTVIDAPLSGAAKTVTESRDEIDALKFRNEALFKQLNQEGELREQTDKFYSRCVSILLDLCKSDANTSLHEQLQAFKKLIRSETGIERLEVELSKLRELALKAEMAHEDAPQKKSGGLIGRLIRTDKNGEMEALISQLREGYQELINGLGLYLDEEYIDKLQKLTRSIQSIRSISDYLEVRNDMLSIICEYTENVSSEREYVAVFVKDMWKRILDVDAFLNAFLRESDSDWENDQSFHQLLKQQIDDLSGKTRLSQTLEELKQVVETSLESMKNAIEKKYQQELKVQAATNERLGDLQSHLKQLKAEVVTAREHADVLKKEAYTDPLTGAYNRRAYEKKIKEQIGLFQRYQSIFSTVIFDVDHFKKINDGFGHAVGDKCLKEIIKRIQPVLREVDFLARFGGEEFVIVLPETDSDGAMIVAEKIRILVEKISFIHKGDTVKITISLGVTEVAKGDSIPESIFNRMDMALYSAKNTGRNKTELKLADA